MGRVKARLPLGAAGDTFLARIARTFLSAGIPDLVVVTGCAADTVRGAAPGLAGRIRFEHNPEWTAGQLSSLLAGLRPRRGDLLEAALVTLVDAPLISVDTVCRVLAAWRATGAPIVRPAQGAVHGHPVIFDRRLFGELQAADPARGAKSVVRAHEAEILNVPVDDPGAFIDIDTEDDYRRILGDR